MNVRGARKLSALAHCRGRKFAAHVEWGTEVPANLHTRLQMQMNLEWERWIREGIVDDSLQTLEERVRVVRAEQAEADRRTHVAQVQLHMRAVRQLVRYLRPGQAGEIHVPNMTDDGEDAS